MRPEFSSRRGDRRTPCGVRAQIFGSGAVIVGMGLLAPAMLADRDEAFGLLHGALTLGGGLLICGLFSLRMWWHAVIGAGVVALLGAARGAANLPDLARMTAGATGRGTAPVFEALSTAICLLLVWRVLAVLRRERSRRMAAAATENE